MLYFFKSRNKKDKLYHPLFITAGSEKKAFVLAILNFKKHNYLGTPVLV